jgi:Flp pilus assembly protein protease CpaA
MRKLNISNFLIILLLVSPIILNAQKKQDIEAIKEMKLV